MRRSAFQHRDGRHLDDPAFAHLPVPAIVQHVPQLRAEKRQLGDAALDALQMPKDDPIGRFAGQLRFGAQAHELADGLDVEAELPRMADEAEAGHVLRSVAPLAAFRARRDREEADLLVIADGGDFHVDPA
jgi:hypothetical protein